MGQRNSTCVCGLTLRAGTRVVIPDADRFDRLDDGQKTAYRNAGIRRCNPRRWCRSGKLLGMISTHWRNPYQPTEGELSNFDILARQSRRRDRAQPGRASHPAERGVAGRPKGGLAVRARRPSPGAFPRRLVRGACDHFGPETRTAFYLANPDRTAFHHVTGMEAGYAKAIDGFKIGPESLSCGLATHTGRPVLTADVRDEPLWGPWLGLADKFDFRGCWSFPLHTAQGKLLGTFAVYWRQPHRATERDVAFANAVTDTAAIIISRNIEAADRQQAAAGLARAKEEAEAANIAKDNFLATLSHELRTPADAGLATLSSWETHRSFPAEFAEDLEVVRRNVDLEARLIDDLLDLTRIAKGKVALNPEVLNVQKVLDAVVAMYLPDIKAKRINLSVRPPAGECYVRCDPGRLQQAFWNILKNAVKFTPQGGNIDITTRDDQGGRVQIIFTDTGVGMSQDMLRRLFQPFEQETAGLYGGLGLGLAITKTLLEAQQATIEARSDGPGKGASFIVTLPCVNRQAADDAEPATPAMRESDRPSADRCYRVLLVEDHADTARVLARLLGVNGHTVTTANSIADALVALRMTISMFS